MSGPPSERGAGATIALDALGAEQGPGVVIEAALAAAVDGIAVRVFGRPEELSELSGAEGIEIVAADDRISNDDDPVAAVRGRPTASVVRAAADVAEGGSDALVSSGSTGATMAAALFAMKRIKGVHRPALAVPLPYPGHRPVVLLDGGAGSEARTEHLVQFAYLGAAFAEAVLDVENPRVALLSVGEEAKKGTSTVVEAHDMLRDGELNFVGNVEGGDLFTEAADVIVTDGFTGNVVLKTVEGTARAYAGAVSEAEQGSRRAALGGRLMRREQAELNHLIDPDSTGGAMLLGLRGIAIVGHGSAGARGIENAVRVAAHAVDERAVERTAELLERSGATRKTLREGGGGEDGSEASNAGAAAPAPAKQVP